MNSYLTGNTQYGASSSPTRGTTLDPTGYLERNSQQRSQLAQTALQRTQPTQQSATQSFSPTYTATPTSTFENRTETGRIIPAPIAQIQAPVAPTAPTLAAGQPADEYYNSTAWQAATDWQNSANQLMEQRQLAELTYGKQARDLQQQFDKTPQQVRDSTARAGMLRSSMFTNTLENQLRSLENTLSDALSDRNFADQSYTRGLTSLTSNYSQLMALAAQALASRNAANAGRLGLGTASEADKILVESEIGKMIQELINSRLGGR